MRLGTRERLVLAGVAVLAVPLAVAVGSAAGGGGGVATAAAAGPLERPPDPCPAGTRLELRVDGPTTDDLAARNVATLRVAWSDPGLACVVVDGRATRVASGSPVDFRVRAHAFRLQRVVVGPSVALVRVPPGATLTFRGGAAATGAWALEAPWLDPWQAPAADTHCPRDPRHTLAPPCREGFARVPWSTPDALCREGGGGPRRCVREARIRLVRRGSGTPPTDRSLATCRRPAAGAAFGLRGLRRWCEFGHAPEHCEGGACRYPVLDTGHGQVHLAVGPGERWTVSFDEGGRVEGALE